MFNYNIKFLTCDESLHLKNGDFKSFRYETKKKTDESVYDVGKRTFCERRSGHWRAPRPRQIRQLESKLRDRNIVSCEWVTESLIALVFSSGSIAYLTVKTDTLDVIQILFDRYCVGKLSGQSVTGVVMCQSHLMFTHADRMATLLTYGKNAGNRIPCRISDRDPHIQSIELGGGSRRSERHVSWSEIGGGVKVLVWSANTAEPAPWSPVIEDHANLHLYHINGQQISLIVYHQLENETLSADLSSKCESVTSIVHIIEQITCHKNGVSLEWLRYEVPNSEDKATKLTSLRECATRVSLPAPARVTRRSPCDLKILTACIDGSLHIIHSAVGVTHSVRAGFIASEVRWAGELIVATEEGGRVQCFDRALSLLHHYTKCFDLTSYLRDAKRTQILATRQAKGGPLMLVSFTGGPLALLHITHPRLLTAWVRSGRASSAVALLRALDWAGDGSECLWAVNQLVCAALRSGPEAANREGCAQAALGAYLAPRAPLPPAAARYAPPLHDLARKFYHHLLRRGRLEKALSLAVDLRAWDLCCDARWAAERLGRRPLAAEAAALAAHYAPLHSPESECSESCSQCSSHSYTDDETSASSEIVKTKPPPLPRVSMPTVMPVPITHAEPAAAHSIRPGLHQYLERDNTIWTTDVDDTYVKINSHDKLKPILSQGVRWHSVDNSLNSRSGMHTLTTISEVAKPASTIVDIIPRAQDERTTSSHFKNVYQTELRDDAPVYRYHTNSYHLSALSDRTHKYDGATDKSLTRCTEKNKVKFSDTVTIAVVSEPSTCPEAARELADSLPLCPPHRYLAAFAPSRPPRAAPASTAPTQTSAPPPPAPGNGPQHSPKIKVVHFGMV